MNAATAAKSLQSCPTLCDPIDSSPPGSPIPGILQAKTLEWVAISFSNAWKWKAKVKSLSLFIHKSWIHKHKYISIAFFIFPREIIKTRVCGPFSLPEFDIFFLMDSGPEEEDNHEHTLKKFTRKWEVQFLHMWHGQTTNFIGYLRELNESMNAKCKNG